MTCHMFVYHGPQLPLAPLINYHSLLCSITTRSFAYRAKMSRQRKLNVRAKALKINCSINNVKILQCFIQQKILSSINYLFYHMYSVIIKSTSIHYTSIWIKQILRTVLISTGYNLYLCVTYIKIVIYIYKFCTFITHNLNKTYGS